MGGIARVPGVSAQRAIEVPVCPSRLHQAASVLRHQWPAFAIFVICAGLLGARLGNAYLWEDEADTAVLASNIVQYGLPVAWDGVTFIDPDYGQRLTNGFVMISHPWLQYYAAAASFVFFGETPWAARLPFALAGLTTVIVVYAMIVALIRNRRVAVSAALLLTLNVQFLLYSRQARNYSFNALLTCLLIWQFHRLTSPKAAAAFAVIAILLFHAHPIGLAAVATLGLLTLVSPSFASARRWFWLAAIAVIVYSAPWLLASQAGYAQNLTPLDDASPLATRLLQLVIECASVTPLIGLLGLSVVLRYWRGASHSGDLKSTCRKRFLTPEERSLVVACVAVAVVEVAAVATTHTRDGIWIEGLHQAPAIIPLVVIPTGLLMVKVSGSSRTAWIALMLVFGFTRLAQVAPWTFWASPTFTPPEATNAVSFHVPRTAKDRLLRTTQSSYVRSLVGPDDPGVVARTSDFLRRNAAPDDVVVTNFAWEPLYFHTRLPQGMKVAPSFPIYRAARAAGLPNYVFSAADARWIVWRRAWPAFFKEQNIERILQQFREAGMATRLVAEIPETLYENRENIHFHRFAADAPVFPQPAPLPNALIYHIETFDEAIVHYQRDLAREPHNDRVLTELGIALLATGQIDQAVAAFRRALEVKPEDAAAERNLANALYDSRDAVGAELHARRAVALGPRDPYAYDVLGRALAVQGQMAEAVLRFEEALGIDPVNAEVREHLARVRQVMR
jgi:Tfp pilus assembly protein PilF